jgi:putative hemolysin
MTVQIQTLAAAGEPDFEISTDRYEVRFAQTQKDIESALRLRYEVFNLELANEQLSADSEGLEYDEFDYHCRHLIVVEKKTQKTVGTYRVNSIETAGDVGNFYSFCEFSIEDLPADVLEKSVEIGRACIAYEHRNTRVLFLLWRGLADHMKETDKRFLFGCCSIFTTDCSIGMKAFQHLKDQGFFHDDYGVKPRDEKACASAKFAADSTVVELPSLFNMYLRIGAKVCGPPVIDREFGTIDFFVVFDVHNLSDKYQKLFFGDRFQSQTKTRSSKSNLNAASKLKTVEHLVP